MRKNTAAAGRVARNRSLRLVCIGASAGGLAALSKIDDHHVVLSRGPRRNNFRPAIDPLFKSAARTFGPNAIGVILSGALDDGSAGLAELKQAGGVAIVQDPEDATFPDMPRHALAAVKADYVLKATQIGAQLNQLVASARPGGHTMESTTARTRAKRVIDEGETDPQARLPGRISTLTCPECGGTLWEKREGKVLRFLCHTGHGFSTQSLLHAQDEGVEAALWAALRVLKERAVLVAKLAVDERQSRYSRYRAEELDLKLRIEALRKVLLSGSHPYSSAAGLKLRN